MGIGSSRRFGPVELEVANVDREDVLNDLVRLDLKYRPFSRAGQVIVVKCNGKKTRLVSRGPKKGEKENIGLDSEARRILSVKPGGRASFEFSEAGFMDEWIWAWCATNAMPRVAARLGLLSMLLGIAGLVLGIISLVISWRSPA